MPFSDKAKKQKSVFTVIRPTLPNTHPHRLRLRFFLFHFPFLFPFSSVKRTFEPAIESEVIHTQEKSNLNPSWRNSAYIPEITLSVHTERERERERGERERVIVVETTTWATWRFKYFYVKRYFSGPEKVWHWHCRPVFTTLFSTTFVSKISSFNVRRSRILLTSRKQWFRKRKERETIWT